MLCGWVWVGHKRTSNADENVANLSGRRVLAKGVWPESWLRKTNGVVVAEEHDRKK